MTSTANQIANLMVNNGKTAAQMTHAGKILGNGSMQAGFSRIGTYFAREVAKAGAAGLKTGRIEGAVVSVVGTSLLFGGIWAGVSISEKRKRKQQNDAEHEAEGQEILRTMEEATPDEEFDSGVFSEDSEIDTTKDDDPEKDLE